MLDGLLADVKAFRGEATQNDDLTLVMVQYDGGARYECRQGARVASEVVEASGHLIDSGILNGIFDTVIRHNATFEVLRFTIGRTNAEPSLLSMRVTADDRRGRSARSSRTSCRSAA